MPGGPQPLRGVHGKERNRLDTYPDGRPFTKEDAEKVKKNTLVAIRVAHILALCWERGIPFGYETPQQFPKQVSMLNHDEYQDLLGKQGVEHTVGLQCPFGAQSAKPTSWVTYLIDWTVPRVPYL